LARPDSATVWVWQDLTVSARNPPSTSRTFLAREHAAIGTQLAAQGRYRQAIARLRRSVELEPAADALHNLGFVCTTLGRPAEAAAAFSHALRLQPDSVNTQRHLAAVLEELGRSEDALRAYVATVRLDPQQYEVHFRIGQLLLARSRNGEAASAFRAAAATKTNPAMAKVSEAYAAHASGDDELAEAVLRALVADQPDCATGWLTLGEVLEHSARFDEAAMCLERGISTDPSLVSAWLSFARIKTFSADDRPLIHRIASRLNEPGLRQSDRRAVLFSVGKAYDDLGDCREAMRCFDEANRIRSPGAFDRDMLARQVDTIVAATPPGFLEASPAPGSDDPTPILIVGMPRSGTTLVEQILSSHPAVAAGGELRYWGEMQARGPGGGFELPATPESAKNLAEGYLAILRAVSASAARVTDKMPFNFERLGLILRVFPRAKVIHCRRHPLDTCLSIYTTITETTFDFAGDRANLAFYYRLYQRLMAHWREVLPPERFIELDYESLVADPETWTRWMIAECGLNWDGACLAPHQNKRRISTPSSWQARQPVYRTSVARWKRYEPWLGALRSLAPEGDVS
jgi:tetratricopeptide (TPR) repeat protein